MSDAPAVAIDASKDGAILSVKVQPGAPRSAVKGAHGGALKVAVAAPPEKGKANEELVRLLARALDLDRRGLEVVAGETGREKRVLVRGIQAAALAERVAKLLASIDVKEKRAKG